MGLFVNPDQSAFQSALNAQIYVDKSGLIEYTNRRSGSLRMHLSATVVAQVWKIDYGGYANGLLQQRM